MRTSASRFEPSPWSPCGSDQTRSRNRRRATIVVLPATYDLMTAAGLDPTAVSDAQLSLYADFCYEFDHSRRVTKETVQSGSRTFSFSYAQSNNAQGYNSWATKTVETLPDGNQNILYCNYAGQSMLKVFQSGASQWCQY